MAALVNDPPLLLVLVGATGSGKTALALDLAERLGGEIVSCDSVAVYRGMDVGSAKPTLAERARVPHHLLDVVTPDVEYSAGAYGRAAREAVQSIAARGRVPIVAGGTGLYLRALLDGLSAVPPRDEDLRARLQRGVARRGVGVLHRALRRLDAPAAARIHANDASKLIRAIEINVLAGQPTQKAWTGDQPRPLLGFRVVPVGLAPPRDLLYRRIDERCQRMFTHGLVEETRNLLAQHGSARPLRALGYAQAQAVLRGDSTVAEALAETRQGHRNYAKRQGTWFRKDPRITWVEHFGEEAAGAVLQHIDRR